MGNLFIANSDYKKVKKEIGPLINHKDNKARVRIIQNDEGEEGYALPIALMPSHVRILDGYITAPQMLKIANFTAYLDFNDEIQIEMNAVEFFNMLNHMSYAVSRLVNEIDNIGNIHGQ